MIPFSKSTFVGTEEKHILSAMKSRQIGGDGQFSKKCQKWFEKNLPCKKALLTSSCTHALEMCALLIGIEKGDEVIMPSYTFVSTANAFVFFGARIVFVDINLYTMNMDERVLEEAITCKTKAIVPVHYAGVSCDMDKVMNLANKYNLWIVEDAAQAMMSEYKSKALGTIGHLGVYSFHETKNYTSAGEGGLLIINDEKFIERAEIIRNKGTNRSQFFRGMVDKYSWVDIGSSYLMSDVSAAYLWGQLESADEVNEFRLEIWQDYYKLLQGVKDKGMVELPRIPKYSKHNAHMFYVKLEDFQRREELIKYLLRNEVASTFHYIPLHTSLAGKKYGSFVGEDKFTTKESERLLRLPIWYGMKKEQVKRVCKCLQEYFNE